MPIGQDENDAPVVRRGRAVGTGQLRQSVQALRRLERDPVTLLELLNATMVETMPKDAAPSFAAVVLGTATPTPEGGLRLELAGGGHQPPLIVRRAGVEEIEIGGTLVGAVPSARFRCRSVDLAPGEACVLHTDGVTEARGHRRRHPQAPALRPARPSRTERRGDRLTTTLPPTTSDRNADYVDPRSVDPPSRGPPPAG